MQNLRDADLKGKRVLYRADYNVPLKDGKIQDDFRIVSSFPTLNYMLEKGAKVIIMSHLGRPDGHEIAELSLRPVAERIADEYPKRHVHMANKMFDPQVDELIASMGEGEILILPNVRFYAEEEQNNEGFGQHLAQYGDIFVLDAFACAHRAHASVVAPAKYLPSYPGFLMEKEVEMLGGLLAEPEHPFVVIMGGAKVSDKIDMINQLGAKADSILIGGAMANTFLLAQGDKIGDSKAEPEKRHVAEQLMHAFGSKLYLAPDYVRDSEDPDHFRFLDVGEKSVAAFKDHLKDAKTVFWNGSLGYTEEEAYAKGSTAIAEYIAGMSGVTSVVAGGDTVELISSLNLHDKFSFVSTGGGAALEFLSGAKLPGVEALESHGMAPVAPADPTPVENAPETKPTPETPAAEPVKEEVKEVLEQDTNTTSQAQPVESEAAVAEMPDTIAATDAPADEDVKTAFEVVTEEPVVDIQVSGEHGTEMAAEAASDQLASDADKPAEEQAA